MNKSIIKRLTTTIIVVLLIALAIAFLYPLFFLLINSLKDRIGYLKDPLGLPKELNFENYISLFKSFGLMKYVGNSMIICVVSIGLTLCISVFAAYAFARLRFSGKNSIYLTMMSTMIFPAQVTMIPLFVMFSKMGLTDSRLGLILVTTASLVPGTILLLRSNFFSIPKEMFEAARLDGAGYFGVVWNVLVPMAAPSIAISSVFNFLAVFNDMFRPMILISSSEKKTLAVALSSFVNQRASNITFVFAGMFVSAMLTLIVYLIFSKYIVKGLTVGSVK